MIDTNFGYENHDFSSILDTIKRFYPVEHPENYLGENIENFLGLNEMGDLTGDNFFKQKNYRERWVKFKKFLKQELKFPVEETMVAFFPCYSGAVTLKKVATDNHVYKKELHFFISLLGPYYTIIGLDKSEVILEEFHIPVTSLKETIDIKYTANHAITVSPYYEYETPFLLLQNKIKEYFPNLRFTPFAINQKKIAGISLIAQDAEGEMKDSIFSGLYTSVLGLKLRCFPDVRGNTFYGIEEW